MSKLKPIGYEELERKLRRAGYVAVRKSKHMIYFHPGNGITVPIPHKHPRSVSIGLLHKIMKEMRVSSDDFNEL